MLFKAFLTLHIISAGISLFAGAIAASTVKGSKIHKRSGRFFVPGMIVATISAIVLSQLNPNYMLMGIGLFSLYLTLSGWVWARRSSKPTKNKQSKLLGIFALASSIFLIGIALGNWPKLNIVALVFGLLQLFFGIIDLKDKNDPAKNIPKHGGRMGGAYIATLTAFLVVNVNFVPFYIVWFLPTIVGTLLLITRLRKWNKTMETK